VWVMSVPPRPAVLAGAAGIASGMKSTIRLALMSRRIRVPAKKPVFEFLSGSVGSFCSKRWGAWWPTAALWVIGIDGRRQP